MSQRQLHFFHEDRLEKDSKKKFQYMTLPLHAVLRQQPPTIIVSALIAAYPKAVSTKCDGELPLHIALKNGASLDVIQNLIVAYPKALHEPNYMKKKPIDVFEENEKLWLNKGIS